MGDLLKNVYDPENFRRQGHTLIDLLADYLDNSLSRQPDRVIPWIEPETAEERWAARLNDTGQEPGQLFRQVMEESIKLHHPRYMGHQVSPAAPVAALAGVLNDLLNNGMGVYEMGIPGTAMERAVVKSVARKMGFGPEADGVLTSGGSLANLTALLTARSATTRQPVWTEGNTSQLALLVSEEAHYCVDRAVRIMGWGEAGIIKVPSDEAFRMRTELLEPLYQQAVAEGKEVIAVVGSACSTSTGSFDDLEAIGRFAAMHGLWFHVDGAHGAATIYAEKYKHLVNGLELADSVVMDFHKMLLSPTITTALIFKQGKNSFRTFTQKAVYLLNQEGDQDWYNLAKRTFETTKTMLSLRAFILLQTYGEAVFDEYITTVNDLCASFADWLDARPGWQLAAGPACNILCFRITLPGLDEAQTNALNERIRQELLEEVRFYVVKTHLRGKTYLRVTLTNPFTRIGDLEDMALNLEAKALRRIQETS